MAALGDVHGAVAAACGLLAVLFCVFMVTLPLMASDSNETRECRATREYLGSNVFDHVLRLTDPSHRPDRADRRMWWLLGMIVTAFIAMPPFVGGAAAAIVARSQALHHRGASDAAELRRLRLGAVVLFTLATIATLLGTAFGYVGVMCL